MNIAAGLTARQREAVLHVDGPLLVLAGPGSGKTRVITRRIAHLIEQGISPRSILGITFTNKAAREMSHRVATLVPDSPVWVTTFHKFGAWVLRRRAEVVGLQQNFSIYDQSDQLQMIRRASKSLGIDAAQFPPAQILGRISRAKNQLLTAENFVASTRERIADEQQAITAKVYPIYQKMLLDANAVDFDDLLLHVVSIFSESPEIREELDQRFRYVLVDEYQDTNLAQYLIVTGLSRTVRNLCVTGDPDQSIYSWRGAQIENILRFEVDYPDARVVRLEENFRSTDAILRTADELIAHNFHRKAKELIGQGTEGKPVELLTMHDTRHEADAIAERIAAEVDAERRRWSDFAIFYRVNAMSRTLETALFRMRIPFVVAASLAFFDRAVVKDLLAYLRLLNNPRDEVAFRRAVNTPARGIGDVTIARLSEAAAERGYDLLEASRQATRIPGLPKKGARNLEAFARLIDELTDSVAGPVQGVLRRVIEETGYGHEWHNSELPDDLDRLAHVEELMTAAHEYDEAEEGEGSLEGFLETTCLVNDGDNIDPTAGTVVLMTLHAAKGLEFPVVYVVGVEQNLIPHERSIREESVRAIEEERRLLFVGITRAREELYLTQTRAREIRGKLMPTIRSEFLREMTLIANDLTTAGASSHDPWPEGSLPRRAQRHDADPYESNLPDVDYDDLPNEPASHEEFAPSESSSPNHDEFFEDAGVIPWASVDVSQTDAATDTDSKRRAIPSRPRPRETKRRARADSSTSREVTPIHAMRFQVGMSVRHPRYGMGVVLSVGGSTSPLATVTVSFPAQAETLTFVAAKCPLQPVGLGEVPGSD